MWRYQRMWSRRWYLWWSKTWYYMYQPTRRFQVRIIGGLWLEWVNIELRCACDNPNEIYYHEKCIKKASADQSAVTESNAESPFEELGQCHVDTCDGRPLKYGISYAKCCCELGNKWTTGDDQCSMCPQRTSPQWNDLCQLEVVDFNVSWLN